MVPGLARRLGAAVLLLSPWLSSFELARAAGLAASTPMLSGSPLSLRAARWESKPPLLGLPFTAVLLRPVTGLPPSPTAFMEFSLFALGSGSSPILSGWLPGPFPLSSLLRNFRCCAFNDVTSLSLEDSSCWGFLSPLTLWCRDLWGPLGKVLAAESLGGEADGEAWL